MSIKYSPVDIARQFSFVREADIQNTGLMVESIQHWSGGEKGQSWCAYFILFILDICFGGKTLNPIKRSGAVQVIYDQAKTNGWIVNDSQPGDLFIYVNDVDHAHHIGFVTVIGGSAGIAGNTSEDGKSSNGNGVYEHGISTNREHVKYIRYPK
jgi:hypothetical protein